MTRSILVTYLFYVFHIVIELFLLVCMFPDSEYDPLVLYPYPLLLRMNNFFFFGVWDWVFSCQSSLITFLHVIIIMHTRKAVHIALS